MKRLSYVIGLGALVCTYQACEQMAPSQASLSSLSVDSLSVGGYSSKPHIRCSLQDSAGHELSRFGSDLAYDHTTANPVSNQTFTLNCSNTSDDAFKGGGMTYALIIDGTPSSLAQANSAFTLPLTRPKTYAMQVRATNAAGITQVKNFSIIATCSPDTYPPLTINTAAVSITQSGDPNQFTYNAASAVSGGSGRYQYSWDFNGADALDLYDASAIDGWVNPVIWSDSATATKVYTAFAGVRKKNQLAVLDTVCNTSLTQSFGNTFAIPRVATGSPIPAAELKPNYYLQGDVAQPTPTLFNSNGQFIAIQTPTANPNLKKHVTCGYNRAKFSDKAGFHIQGMDWFDRDDKPLAEHGIYLEVNNISDSGATGSQPMNSVTGSSLTLDKAQYFTAESSDGQKRLSYERVDACQIEMIVTRLAPGTPCAGDAATIANDAVQIEGRYSCPHLATNDALHMPLSINNGYFYCEVSSGNQCSGGGGGGGGVPPVPR